MSDESDVYLSLLSIFALCSVIAVGGATSAVPEMHRQAVDVHHWIGDRGFTELFAIAQASPGPNVVFVTLLGHYIGGIPGALIAMFAMCAPSCTIAYCAARVVDRFRHAPWRIVLQAGLVPVTIGLIASSALIVARAADHDIPTLLITAASFALCYWTRVTPLLALALAAALGLTGVL
jgi:chromate transporter